MSNKQYDKNRDVTFENESRCGVWM